MSTEPKPRAPYPPILRYRLEVVKTPFQCGGDRALVVTRHDAAFGVDYEQRWCDACAPRAIMDYLYNREPVT